MKKLMIALGAVAMAAGVQAACIDWNYLGATEADAGKTVYIIAGSTAQQTWESVAAIEAAAISIGGSGTIAKNGRNYTIDQTIASPIDAGSSAYFVIVSADQSKYGVSSVQDMSALIYDPEKQEGSKGIFDAGSLGLNPTKDFGGGPGPEPIPEPTSGLLLLLRVAGLALKRRRA